MPPENINEIALTIPVEKTVYKFLEIQNKITFLSGNLAKILYAIDVAQLL